MLIPMKKKEIGTVTQSSLTTLSDSFDTGYLVTFDLITVFNKTIFTQSYPTSDRIFVFVQKPGLEHLFDNLFFRGIFIRSI
ncbi:hypothetical protein ACBF42_005398, partial [Escherichia coli]